MAFTSLLDFMKIILHQWERYFVTLEKESEFHKQQNTYPKHIQVVNPQDHSGQIHQVANQKVSYFSYLIINGLN